MLSYAIPAWRYGLDGSGIESRWERDFPHPSRLALGPTQPTVTFLGVHLPGRGVDHPPPSNAKFKERVELNFYCPLWAFVTRYGMNLTLRLFLNGHIKRTCRLKLNFKQGIIKQQMTHTNSWKEHKIRKVIITQLSYICSYHVISNYTFKI
jgi:hypothetical protein